MKSFQHSSKIIPASNIPKPQAGAPLNEILEYYRKRVDEIQKERDDWFIELEKIRISQEDFYKMELELKRKSEEIVDLQKSLSDAQVQLFEEREQVLTLKREVADLKAMSIEDRNKILQLIAVNAKADEDRYYFKDSFSYCIFSRI